MKNFEMDKWKMSKEQNEFGRKAKKVTKETYRIHFLDWLRAIVHFDRISSRRCRRQCTRLCSRAVMAWAWPNWFFRMPKGKRPQCIASLLLDWWCPKSACARPANPLSLQWCFQCAMQNIFYRATNCHHIPNRTTRSHSKLAYAEWSCAQDRMAMTIVRFCRWLVCQPNASIERNRNCCAANPWRPVPCASWFALSKQHTLNRWFQCQFSTWTIRRDPSKMALYTWCVLSYSLGSVEPLHIPCLSPRSNCPIYRRHSPWLWGWPPRVVAYRWMSLIQRAPHPLDLFVPANNFRTLAMAQSCLGFATIATASCIRDCFHRRYELFPVCRAARIPRWMRALLVTVHLFLPWPLGNHGYGYTVQHCWCTSKSHKWSICTMWKNKSKIENGQINRISLEVLNHDQCNQLIGRDNSTVYH